MAELVIRFQDVRHKKGSIKLNNYSVKALGRLKKAIRKSAIILESQIKRNLGGPSHTRNPGNGNPFPGILHGRLQTSVNFQIKHRGLTAVIGPNTKYAITQEVGGGHVPARPYVGPAMQEHDDKIVKMLMSSVTETLK